MMMVVFEVKMQEMEEISNSTTWKHTISEPLLSVVKACVLVFDVLIHDTILYHLHIEIALCVKIVPSSSSL